MTNLTYGDPPTLEECVDLGTVPLEIAPKIVENQGVFAMQTWIEEYVGTNVPAVRRIWMTIAHYRDAVDDPWTVKIPGLGRLVYSNGKYGENWQIVKE